MAAQHTNSQVETVIRRKLLVRLSLHWAMFFGLVILLVSALEFLYGEPQRPSPDVVGRAVRKHAAMIVALLALIPIALRDSLRCVQHVVQPILRRAAEEKEIDAALQPAERSAAPVRKEALESSCAAERCTLPATSGEPVSV